MRYELVWEMNRKLAKRLVRKQFFRYRFVKYVTGWTLLIEGILMCCLPLKFSFLSCCVYLVCFFWIAIGIYVLHCCAMYPKSGFLAQYRAEFYDRFFIVSGKNYQRKYVSLSKVLFHTLSGSTTPSSRVRKKISPFRRIHLSMSLYAYFL